MFEFDPEKLVELEVGVDEFESEIVQVVTVVVRDVDDDEDTAELASTIVDNRGGSKEVGLRPGTVGLGIDFERGFALGLLVVLLFVVELTLAVLGLLSESIVFESDDVVVFNVDLTLKFVEFVKLVN